MRYAQSAIAESEIPAAVEAVFQHALDTYASETNKIVAAWRSFGDEDLEFKPGTKSASVRDIMRHQLLSERRFFAEFLAAPEPQAAAVLPEEQTVDDFCRRMRQLAIRRLAFLAAQTQDWWMELVPFFNVRRQRAWIFWRRVLHSCHHRTQLAMYLRMLGKPVPSIYGPTADVTWQGADPTTTPEAAGRQ